MSLPHRIFLKNIHPTSGEFCEHIACLAANCARFPNRLGCLYAVSFIMRGKCAGRGAPFVSSGNACVRQHTPHNVVGAARAERRMQGVGLSRLASCPLSRHWNSCDARLSRLFFPPVFLHFSVPPPQPVS